jgi:hypothetical protein
VCERLFGSVPVRVAHELNVIRHKGAYEGRPKANRPLSRAEQDRFFTVVNKRAEAAATLHRTGAAAAYRDAIVFLTMLGWGYSPDRDGWPGCRRLPPQREDATVRPARGAGSP